jgi:hypothetical protein
MKSFLLTSARWTTSTVVILLVFGCGGSGKKLTPEQETAAGALCGRAKDCSLVSSSEMQECKQQIAAGLQIFPDPEAFASCVQALSCSELADPSDDSITTCTDWNYSTIKCSGESTLGACSNSGKCTTISCPDVCNLMDGSFAYCGYDDDRGWDVCWCRM